MPRKNRIFLRQSSIKTKCLAFFAAGVFAMANGIDAFIREKFQCELIGKAELPNTAGGHLPVWH